jgi:MoaA/NifB/PqqE/SkfB family radical SAM enzyme
MPLAAKAWDMLRLIRRGGPALCNIAVTSACNAKCGFCNFARGKIPFSHLRWIDAARFGEALDILHRRHVRYVSFFGGEPLLHPELPRMIALAVERGMGTALITNGWLLPSRLDQLAAAGLRTVYVSIDSPDLSEHEANRGLAGLAERIRFATGRMSRLGMTALAQVTMSKLITDYNALAPMLRDLGFDAIAFSYPQSARLGSSSLAWSDSSKLVNFTPAELIQAFDAVDELRGGCVVNNPRESVADMKRHLRGEEEQFVCYGGYKSFYMDWNFDVWRCDAWKEPLCPVWDFLDTPLVRDGCTACVADCYRDSSVMLHFAVSIGDAIDEAIAGRLFAALRKVWDRRNLGSAAAVAGNARILSQLASLNPLQTR